MTTKLTPPANPIGAGDGAARVSAGARLADAPTGMKARARIWLRLGLAGCGLAAVLACNTPSVPLPPPVLTVLSFQPGPDASHAVLHGTPNSQHADALFQAFNHQQGEGVLQQAAHDGTFTTEPFLANDGDLIEIWYDTPGQERSQSACVNLHVGQPLLSVHCP